MQNEIMGILGELMKPPIVRFLEAMYHEIEGRVFQIIDEEVELMSDSMPSASYGFLTPFTVQVRLAAFFKLKHVPEEAIAKMMQEYEARRRLNAGICVYCCEPLDKYELELGHCKYCYDWSSLKVMRRTESEYKTRTVEDSNSVSTEDE